MDTASHIEAILFYRNEPITVAEIARLLSIPAPEVVSGLSVLAERLSNRGIRLIQSGEEAVLATAPEASELLLRLRKEELSRDLGKAGAETLAILLYKAPVSRSEIDFIRGVNSSFILRNLLVRGLVEKMSEGGRGVRYRPTPELLAFLGVSSATALPNFERVSRELAQFAKDKENAEAEATSDLPTPE